MKTGWLFSLALTAVLGAACAMNSGREKLPTDWEQTSYVERGHYLVNYLGHCTGCHTPLGADGESDRSLFLSGVPAKFAGATAGPPQVAGFPGPRGSRVYARMKSSVIQPFSRDGSAQPRITVAKQVSMRISKRRALRRSDVVTRSRSSGRIPRGSGDHQPSTGSGSRASRTIGKMPRR